MASLFSDAKGNRTVQFVDKHKKRRSVRLGKMTLKEANGVKLKIESINSSLISGLPREPETDEWIKNLGKKLRAKLEAVGLIKPTRSLSLGAFLDEYIASRTDLKPGPKYNLEVARDRMLAFFDPNVLLRDITPGDGDRWAISLRAEYAEATAARTLKHGRQFLHAARRDKLADENPFDHIKPGSMANPERLVFVSHADTEKLIEASPCVEWRAIIALARYGGLRTPSETLELTWGDVLWDQGKFRVRSPKLERMPSKGVRWVPIFPELKPYLEALFDAAEPGAVYLINRYRSARQNLRTQLERVILKAGISPFEKPFQNMRSSRETELTERFPLHVVTAWIGNSAAVAAKHYLQVTDDHFAAAANGDVGALQKAVQSGAGAVRHDATSNTGQNPEVVPCREVTENDGRCDNIQTTRLGFEPRQRVPKTLVLPLHHRVIMSCSTGSGMPTAPVES